jgi:hypothetical protein
METLIPLFLEKLFRSMQLLQYDRLYTIELYLITSRVAV